MLIKSVWSETFKCVIKEKTEKTFTHLSLEKLAGGLFTSVSWSGGLPVNLSDEVVEDLQKQAEASVSEGSGRFLCPESCGLGGTDGCRHLVDVYLALG